jgi:hypothetical protein
MPSGTTASGSDATIVAKKVSLNGYPILMIGVLPASFYFPKKEQLYGSQVAGWRFGVEYFHNLNLGRLRAILTSAISICRRRTHPP